MKTTIFTAVQNEGPYLLDWIAHHRVLGVDDIVIYSYLPEDGTAKILDLLAEHNIIHHIKLTEGHPSPFVHAQKHFWDTTLREESEWVMGLDVREYLNIKSDELLLSSILERQPNNIDSLVLPVQIFGHNGNVEISDAPVINNLNRCGTTPAIFPFEATYGKCLMRNKKIFHGIGFYRGKQKPPGKSRDLTFATCNGDKLPDYYAQHEKRLSIMGAYEGDSELVVNFYPLRSVGDYIINGYYSGPQHKHSQADLQYWIENNFNNIEELSIMKSDARRSRERIHIFNAVEGLRGQIDQSLKWHRDRLQEALLDRKNFDLHNTCMLAQNSEQPKRSVAQKLYILRQKQEDLEYEEELERAREAEEKREKRSKRKRKLRRESNKA